jgi:hypothetical protein
VTPALASAKDFSATHTERKLLEISQIEIFSVCEQHDNNFDKSLNHHYSDSTQDGKLLTTFL